MHLVRLHLGASTQADAVAGGAHTQQPLVENRRNSNRKGSAPPISRPTTHDGTCDPQPLHAGQGATRPPYCTATHSGTSSSPWSSSISSSYSSTSLALNTVCTPGHSETDGLHTVTDSHRKASTPVENGAGMEAALCTPNLELSRDLWYGQEAIFWASTCLLVVFAGDVLLHFYVEGWRMFRSIVACVDAVVVFGSLCITLSFKYTNTNIPGTGAIVAFRVWKIIRIMHAVAVSTNLGHRRTLTAIVSANKAITTACKNSLRLFEDGKKAFSHRLEELERDASILVARRRSSVQSDRYAGRGREWHIEQKRRQAELKIMSMMFKEAEVWIGSLQLVLSEMEVRVAAAKQQRLDKAIKNANASAEEVNELEASDDGQPDSREHLQLLVPAADEKEDGRFLTSTVNPFVAVLLAYPLGMVMASITPKVSVFGIPLNPGQFNFKEHALIYVFASTCTQPAYALYSIIGQRYQLHQDDLSAAACVFFGLVTQCFGYGLAGLCRRFLVRPAAMLWPSNLSTVALLNSLHQQDVDPALPLSRFNFFWIVAGSIFCWQWIPGLIAPLFTAVSILCLVAPKTGDRGQMMRMLGSAYNGTGLLSFTFDWTLMTLLFPITTPLWALLNQVFGLWLVICVLTPILWVHNSFGIDFTLGSLPQDTANGSGLFPLGQALNTPALFDKNGVRVSARSFVNNADLTLKTDVYNASAPIHNTYFALLYMSSFIVFAACLVHVGLWYDKDVWRRFSTAMRDLDNTDIHAKMWTFTLTSPTSVLIALILPGRLAAVMTFKTFSHMALGHYVKIPPRAMFAWWKKYAYVMSAALDCGTAYDSELCASAFHTTRNERAANPSTLVS
ncbi:OPT oligopeptide transporter protein-domain-containing protein [Zopfochytrium polystomum]|nr:OPT oligopeptide transporter protein-domain-containing protein [Zopfochytrium polystomum]